MKNFIQDGNNITLIANQVVGPNSPPKSGDQVVAGRLVGVVNADAASTTDSVVITTRGVFSFSVRSGHNGISVGETVFIDPVDGSITDDFTDVPFGIALGVVNAGATTLINVRLFGSTPGATGANS